MRIKTIILAALCATPFATFAQTLPAEVRLLNGWWTENGTHMAAFDIQLEDGWKTYWRAPGDNGIPPRLFWRGSENLAAARLHWPTPSVYSDEFGHTIGFSDRLVLPVELSPREAGKSVTAAGTIEIGVCEDICVPIAFRFALEIPMTYVKRPEIQTALDKRPKVRSGNDIPGLACVVDPIADGLQLKALVPISAVQDFDAAIFEYSDPEIWISPPQIEDLETKQSVLADFVPPDAQPFALNRSGVRMTLIGSSGATEIIGCPSSS